MKFSLSAVILALAASQTMAVIPIPVKECTKSIIVQPSDSDGCDLFASRHNTTFENMRKWNEKLRTDCANLDVGHPICVSVTKGDCCLADPNATTVVTSTIPTTATTTGGAVPTTTPANGTATTTASTISTPVASNSATTLPTTTTSNPANATTPATDKKNDATGSKSSMVLAAAGVVLSVAYMF